ncbi:MAG: DUF3347 domain-containing protein [Marinoscillum sp.]|uniref:DUF3347 domain-containing protein n=1 Tax=Marinoscillum sp. TaxID=2024838 RepID=UPI003303A460
MKTTLLTLGFALAIASCSSAKKEEQPADNTTEIAAKGEQTAISDQQPENALTPVLDAYLMVKDALVNDHQEGAANAGAALAAALGSLDLTQFASDKQAELEEIVEVAKNHGEHISESEISDQRAHFEAMSSDIKDLVTIIGTDRTLYHQYCPMYSGGKGGMWLSVNQEIRNPLFGARMLKCGKVEDVISL